MAYVVVHALRPGLPVDPKALSTTREPRKHLQQVAVANVTVLDEVLEFECLHRLLEDILGDLLKLEYQRCAAHPSQILSTSL